MVRDQRMLYTKEKEQWQKTAFDKAVKVAQDKFQSGMDGGTVVDVDEHSKGKGQAVARGTKRQAHGIWQQSASKR